MQILYFGEQLMYSFEPEYCQVSQDINFGVPSVTLCKCTRNIVGRYLRQMF